MNKVAVLVAGEFKRLTRYNLFTANLVVLLIWVIISFFLKNDELTDFLPLIFFVDAALMAILLTGATIFYEKKEHTVNSILVSPVSENKYIVSKIITGILNSFISVLIIALAMFFIKGITFDYLMLLSAVALVSAFHTLLGIAITYITKDFTGLLLAAVGYVLVFALPVLLAQFNVITGEATNYLVALPTGISLDLISASIPDNPSWQAAENWKLIFGCIYLPVLSFVLYLFVKPLFNKQLIIDN